MAQNLLKKEFIDKGVEGCPWRTQIGPKLCTCKGQKAPHGMNMLYDSCDPDKCAHVHWIEHLVSWLDVRVSAGIIDLREG
jgi:hypothetical protein